MTSPPNLGSRMSLVARPEISMRENKTKTLQAFFDPIFLPGVAALIQDLQRLVVMLTGFLVVLEDESDYFFVGCIYFCYM